MMNDNDFNWPLGWLQDEVRRVGAWGVATRMVGGAIAIVVAWLILIAMILLAPGTQP